MKSSNAILSPVAKEICEVNQRSFNKRSVPQLCLEIKGFIKTYLQLREIDKKAIQEWNLPIKSNALRETLRNIVQSSTFSRSQPTTQRYSGGSKERALENVAKGTASDSDLKVLNGEACIWCGKDFLQNISRCEGVKSFYCSQECATEGRLRRGGMYSSTRIRSQLFSLESGICQLCHVDANGRFSSLRFLFPNTKHLHSLNFLFVIALFLRMSALQPPERLNALMNANWTLPKSSKALQNLLQNPKEGDFWQADHIKAVAEGGGSCGLENLRTLCTPCHQHETEKLRFRLKTTGVIESDRAMSKTGDIREFFSKQTKRMKSTSD